MSFSCQQVSFKPQVGAKIGLNINLTVRGKHCDREVYWHRQKEWSVFAFAPPLGHSGVVRLKEAKN